MWGVQALAAALRARAPRFAQRAPAQRLAEALAPTLCDGVWGARAASAAAGHGGAAPPADGVEGKGLGGARWFGAAANSLGAAAERGLGGPPGGSEAAQAAPLAPKRRVRHPGERGEKTADGRPKPDERTVAYLVRPGWFETEDEVVALLTRGKLQAARYPFETAEPAADWLESTLGPEPVVKGLCPAARAVKTYPFLLTRDMATLQRNWDALKLPIEQGGVGMMLSEEQAREAVCKHPPILTYAVDNLRSGWSMLTATEGGLGLPHDEARKSILRNPHVLTSDFERFTKRVELLRSLGYADAHRMVLAASEVLNYKDETVIDHAVWWQQTGLDHLKVIAFHPTLLGVCSTSELQAKLDFLRRMVGMSNAELNNAHSLLGMSLERRLRARFFYALQQQKLDRFRSFNTMFKEKDAVFLAMIQGRPSTTEELASDAEVQCYKEVVSSPAFLEWAAQEEARRRGGAP